MMMPRHCPYCFEAVERTRYWYRNAPDINPETIADPEDVDWSATLGPLESADEMVMVMPCHHSFPSDAWDDYAESCTHYTNTLRELQHVIGHQSAKALSKQLDGFDRDMRIRAEECCQEMERTAPTGIFADA